MRVMIPIAVLMFAFSGIANAEACCERVVIAGGENAVYSPDGTMAVFQKMRDGTYDLGVVELSSGRVTWVVEGEGNAVFPSWTPAGGLVYVYGNDTNTAFSATQNQSQDGYNLYLYDNGKALQLTHGRWRESTPFVTPHGDVYFTRSEGEYLSDHALMWKMPLDRPSEAKCIRGSSFASGAGVNQPSVSPDGKFLVWAEIYGGNWDAWNLRIASTDDPEADRVLIPMRQTAFEPRWCPDSRTIVYSGFEEGDPTWGVYLMDVKSGCCRRLCDGRGGVVSPDGTRLMYSARGELRERRLSSDDYPRVGRDKSSREIDPSAEPGKVLLSGGLVDKAATVPFRGPDFGRNRTFYCRVRIRFNGAKQQQDFVNVDFGDWGPLAFRIFCMDGIPYLSTMYDKTEWIPMLGPKRLESGEYVLTGIRGGDGRLYFSLDDGYPLMRPMTQYYVPLDRPKGVVLSRNLNTGAKWYTTPDGAERKKAEESPNGISQVLAWEVGTGWPKEVPRLFDVAADVSDNADPFIGTEGTGHCTPAACVPFGLVQAGPDTGIGDWAHTAGYQYSDKTILGFSQTHLSGTGCPDLGDLRIMPFTGKANRNVKSQFRKETEKAAPGWYTVTLDDFGVSAEVSATEHAAIYKFTYQGDGEARLLFDCAYGISNLPPLNWMRLTNLVCNVEIGDDGRSLTGFMRRRVWVERDVGFCLAFSVPWTKIEELPRPEGEIAPVFAFTFDVPRDSPLYVKVGLSSTSAEAAKRNLGEEIPGWDFAGVRRRARSKWNDVFSRATVEGSDKHKKKWYTALYHLFVQPNNIADVGDKPFYSTFSCWDTFRAAHPLYTILAPDKAAEFVDSMLEQGRRTGYLPIWTLWGKENQCMIGTHSVPVIVDWFLKEVGGVSSSSGNDNSTLQLETPTNLRSPTPTPNSNSPTRYWRAAYAQIKDTLTKPHDSRSKERWDLLDKYGYYPFDVINGESVSRTLECAYDDWCAGLMAQRLGFADDAEFFAKRAGSWKNVFDSSIGFMRGKDSKGRWREPFNPFALGHGADTGNDFTEGNAFQYSWHVMQEPQGLVAAMGGTNAFKAKLDSLFSEPEKVEGSGCVVDVTGLIGQYVHGNEPSHHVIYFYPQIGHPEKAAERIREVFDRFYLPKPDGLCGNDDCGQMSAWYLFSAMGFYPFNPCGGEYIIGAPQVPEIKIKLNTRVGERTDKFHSPTQDSNSDYFTIIARNLSNENKYVKSVTLNGEALTDWKIRHSDIMKGGELVFEMSSQP